MPDRESNLRADYRTWKRMLEPHQAGCPRDFADSYLPAASAVNSILGEEPWGEAELVRALEGPPATLHASGTGEEGHEDWVSRVASDIQEWRRNLDRRGVRKGFMGPDVVLPVETARLLKQYVPAFQALWSALTGRAPGGPEVAAAAAAAVYGPDLAGPPTRSIIDAMAELLPATVLTSEDIERAMIRGIRRTGPPALKVDRFDRVDLIPNTGENLAIVARITSGGDDDGHVHVRVFGRDGEMVLNAAEGDFPGRAQDFRDLERRLGYTEPRDPWRTPATNSNAWRAIIVWVDSLARAGGPSGATLELDPWEFQWEAARLSLIELMREAIGRKIKEIAEHVLRLPSGKERTDYIENESRSAAAMLIGWLLTRDRPKLKAWDPGRKSLKVFLRDYAAPTSFRRANGFRMSRLAEVISSPKGESIADHPVLLCKRQGQGRRTCGGEMGPDDLCRLCKEPWPVPLEPVWRAIADPTEVQENRKRTRRDPRTEHRVSAWPEFARDCARFLVEIGGGPWRDRVRGLIQDAATPDDVQAACRAALDPPVAGSGRACPEPFQQKPTKFLLVEGQRVGIPAWRCLACGGLMFGHGGHVDDEKRTTRAPDKPCRACARTSWSRSATTLMLSVSVKDFPAGNAETKDRDDLVPALIEELTELLSLLDSDRRDQSKIRGILNGMKNQMSSDREFLMIERASAKGDLTPDLIERLRTLVRRWIARLAA